MSSNPRPGDEKLSAELGADVDDVAFLLKFRIDHARMLQGEVGQLGYILMERQHNPDAIIVYASVATANHALDHSVLIDSLAEEDCLECYVLASPVISELAGCEIILADD